MQPETNTAFVHGDSRSLRDGGMPLSEKVHPYSHTAYNMPKPTYTHNGTNLGTIPMGPNGDLGDE